MTTKPKARKFRIKRTSSTTSSTARASATPAAHDPQGSSDSASVYRAELAHQLNQQNADQTEYEDQDDQDQDGQDADESPQTDMDAIKREGLTGRQLRMARRVAQKHNLAPTSDFDAVRLLRIQGIDPFQRSNLLQLVVPQAGGSQTMGGPGNLLDSLSAQIGGAGSESGGKSRVQLPQTMPAQKQTLPSTELSPSDRRIREISEIQRDIGRRRRRKMALLLTRLTAFVLLPTLLAGWYYYVIATPMYSTKSEFLILQADNAGGGSGLGGLLTGTQFATNQDAIAVQSYLQSKDAMLRLNQDAGYEAHFTQPFIDPIQRMADDASSEEAYKTYGKNVKIGYDPSEGVIKMEVIAADPEIAALFASKLINYAEERVNNLTKQKRGDQMKDAKDSFDNAVLERRIAQENLVKLQQQGAVLDPENVIASLRSQINTVELQLLEKELQLAALLDNSRPNQSRVEGARGDVRRLQTQLAELNAKMTDASEGENSLAQQSVNIQMAQADLATRDMLLQSALQSMEQTRMEASRQVRYLTISVQPVASQDPSYPRAFENTILAFLILSGIYLMISLTASILREQVTS
jgi:capsular polysaccharide transport system permease protein